MTLVGPSGCGKTSPLERHQSPLRSDPGCTVTDRIAVGGRDVRAPDTRLTALRRKVGMVFQQPNPFPLSIADNLRFPCVSTASRTATSASGAPKRRSAPSVSGRR